MKQTFTLRVKMSLLLLLLALGMTLPAAGQAAPDPGELIAETESVGGVTMIKLTWAPEAGANPVGYEIYRKKVKEADWGVEHLLATFDPTTSTCTDGWSGLGYGVYHWLVRALYGDGTSGDMISNDLDVKMYLPTIYVIGKLNVEEVSPEGIEIEFENVSERFDNGDVKYIYDIELPVEGIAAFAYFRKGEYDISATFEDFTLAGYRFLPVATPDVPYLTDYNNVLIDESLFNADGDIRFEFLLEENLDPVTELTVSPTGLVTWTGTNRAIGYKVYLNDVVIVDNMNGDSYQYPLNLLEDGKDYTTEVIAVYASGNSDAATKTWRYADCSNYNVQTNFAVTQLSGTNNAILSWTQPQDEDISEIGIYRDGEIVEVLSGVTLAAIWTDEDLADGDYEYMLRFVYADGAESCLNESTPTVEVRIKSIGGITGYIYAKTIGGAPEQPIQGATIHVTKGDGTRLYLNATNALGKYTIEDIPVGTYTVKFEAEGYLSYEKEDLDVTYITNTLIDNVYLDEIPYEPLTVSAELNADGNVEVTWTMEGDVIGAPGLRALTEFEVYRKTCSGGEPVAIGRTSGRSFTDEEFADSPWGTYTWGVKAKYDLNASDIVYAGECIDHDMETTVTVSVVLNTAAAPTGAKVVFTNTSEPALDLVYEQTLDATGSYTWTDFRKGTYDIEVSLHGYGTQIFAERTISDPPQTFNFLLEEMLSPIVDLYVTPTGLATWVNPLSLRALTGYKVYLDGAFIADVTKESYQYDVSDLEDGKEYKTDIETTYTTGISQKSSFTWTYKSCDNYDAPTNVAVVQPVGTKNAKLTWTNPSLADVDYLRIYRNGVLYKDNLSMATPFTTYTDTSLDNGTYTYWLQFVYDDGAETCLSAATASITIKSTGTISGTVTSETSGAPISGAKITVYSSSNTYRLISNASGVYTGTIEAGIYDVYCEAEGYTPGTNQFTITYLEAKTVNFSMTTGKDISSTDITATLSPDQFTYSGSAITPEPVVKDGDAGMGKGRDYDLSYSDNINVGKATITIKGRGKYIGTKTIGFTITKASGKAPASLPQLTATYGSQYKDVPLSGGFFWPAPEDTIVGNVSTTPIMVKIGYNPDPSNYLNYQTEAPLTILKADPTGMFTFPHLVDDVVVYDPERTLGDLAVAGAVGEGQFFWRNTQLVPSVDVTEYDYVFWPDDTDNYDYTKLSDWAMISWGGSVIRPITLTVLPREIEIELAAEQSYEYTGEAIVPEFTLTGNKSMELLSDLLVFTYEGINDTDYGPSAEAPIEVGDYKVHIEMTGDVNNLPAEAEGILRIIEGVAINEVADNFIISTAPNALIIQTGSPLQVEVYTLTGSLIAQRQVSDWESIPVSAGVYIVKAGIHRQKVIVK